MGKRVRESNGRFSSMWKNTKWFLKNVFIGTAVIFTLAGVYVAGGYANPVVKAELVKEGIPPVLERIIECESHNNHYDKNGQVLMRSNTNKTVDIGVAQINTVWFAKATELGYDLTKEEDNRAMALWIIRNKGTSPYSATYSCWNK